MLDPDDGGASVAKDENPYPHANSEAAEMLGEALAGARARGRSIRQTALSLRYSSPAVLSHMASGRVPIPIDKAPDIARAVGLDQSRFLMAVMEQRHPEVTHLLSGSEIDLGEIDLGFAHELEFIAGTSFDKLSAEQKEVMRQVVTDPRPRRRWLSAAEIPILQQVREAVPSVSSNGLSAKQRRALTDALRSS